MNASQIIRMLETALPIIIQAAKLIAAALEGSDKAADEPQGVTETTLAAETPTTQPAVQAGKRGPGRPKKTDTPSGTLNAPALDVNAVTAFCSDKMKELAGKMNGDEAGARAMVKEAVKGAAGVERLKEVPADKLASVKAAVEALDVPEQGGDDGDADEF